MFIKRIFSTLILLALTACTVRPPDWNAQYGTPPAQNPKDIQSAVYFPEYNMYGDQDNTYAPKLKTKTVAVLLPLSGENANLGKSISKSIELAFLQKKYKNISVNFIDVVNNSDAFNSAIGLNPDIIIGPVFGANAKKLRDLKPTELPVLSFTSDVSAIGDGIISTALLPTQSVEAIVKEIAADKSKNVLILAPKTDSGEIMAASAVTAANIYDLPVSAMKYYESGDGESIKKVAQQVSMWDARSAVNTRAREILSDALIHENLTKSQKSSLNTQLEKISKLETLGSVPYDSVLFLGDAEDSKSMASFLRYFNIGIGDVNFYGTAMWDNPTILRDFSMSGSKFAGLPNTSESFTKLYEKTYGAIPSRIDSFAFDAANIAIGMILSNKAPAAYLLDPSGYNGTDGLIRLRPSGENERALQIMKLGGSGSVKIIKPAPKSFLKPIYQLDTRDIGGGREIEMTGSGINPNEFIKLPDTIKYKYRSKTYGANTVSDNIPKEIKPNIVVLPADDDNEIIENPAFKPTNLESVDRKFIDSVEVTE